jgi:hypothetical protein
MLSGQYRACEHFWIACGHNFVACSDTEAIGDAPGGLLCQEAGQAESAAHSRLRVPMVVDTVGMR